MKINNQRSSLSPASVLSVGTLLSLAITASVHAQELSAHSGLPAAKPGACYVQARIPAKLQTNIQEVVLQEAYEITKPVKAQFTTVAEPVIVKDTFEELTVTDPEFELQTSQIEIQAEGQRWTTTIAGATFPTASATLEQIAGAGIQLESVAPGACYVEHVINEQYADVDEQVLVKEGYEKITTVPAVFETVEERIEIKAAYADKISVPAVFRTETESVLVEPARDVWKACSLLDPDDRVAGEVVCRVGVPERYETLTRTVQVSSPTIRTINVPAIYQTVEVQRLVEPAREIRELIPAVYEVITKQVKVGDAQFLWRGQEAKLPSDAMPTGRTACLEEIPARYTPVEQRLVVKPGVVETKTVPSDYITVAAERLASPASQENIVIPAVTREESQSVELSPERVEWRQVLCDNENTPEAIVAVQMALQREGFSPGPIDGIVGPLTTDAIEKYQIRNNLGVGGITYELMESLGVQGGV